MKSLSGMSAIELLVVIAIIGIIASIGYVSSRSVDTASVFRADREEFKSYLEEARFKAVSSGKHYKVLMQNSGDDITLKLYEPDSGNVKWRDLALNRRCGCYSGTGHSDTTCNNAFSNSALSSLTSISDYDKTIDNIELVGCNNSSCSTETSPPITLCFLYDGSSPSDAFFKLKGAGSFENIFKLNKTGYVE
tara:strand:+ start:155 stop:730 length:576 start_codon:yes stop_codon:yes gene_type:complete